MKKITLSLLLSLFAFSFQTMAQSEGCVPPINLHCEPYVGGVKLMWDPVPGAQSYHVVLNVNSPNCCQFDSSAQTFSYVFQTTNTYFMASSFFYPCFSWQVSTVCQDQQSSYLSPEQCACTEDGPCSTFDNASNPAGNWVKDGVYATYTTINPLDNSNAVLLVDSSGATSYSNSIDYNNLGQNFLNQCLCFDMSLLKCDDDIPSSFPYHPRITLSDGINSITFVSNANVYPGDGWHHICAPIEHCNGSTLPSNIDGIWHANTPGMTCTDFNNVLDNVTSVIISPEINSTISEQMAFDNICVVDCNPCNSDFQLNTTFNSSTSSANASVLLLQQNPNSNYIVDWGDGTSGSLSSSPHYYNTPGSYTVCVTEYTRDKTECTSCLTFCFRGAMEKPSGTDDDQMNKPLNTSTEKTYEEIGAEELINPDPIRVSPNPIKNDINLHIQTSENAKISIHIFDVYGIEIYNKITYYSKGNNSLTIDASKFVNGTYFLKIGLGDKMYDKKIIIFR